MVTVSMRVNVLNKGQKKIKLYYNVTVRLPFASDHQSLVGVQSKENQLQISLLRIIRTDVKQPLTSCQQLIFSTSSSGNLLTPLRRFCARSGTDGSSEPSVADVWRIKKKKYP